jgi:hypothetical protein
MRYLLDHSPWLLLANHYVPAQRTYTDFDICIGELTSIPPARGLTRGVF